MNIETAGSRLKKIRQERGLSLEEIQKKTKIHINVLRAIEGDSISNLNPIYLKGFIKIYCNYLGLDLKEYLGETSQSNKPVLNAAVGRDIGERVEKKPALVKEVAVKLSSFRPTEGLKRVILFTLIAVVFIFLAVKLVSSWHRNLPAKARVSTPARAVKINRELLPKETINKSSA
ncbi:MAG: helix-turn-helix domain-containing protein, partial [Candidatus Omnitrophota bacterium]